MLSVGVDMVELSRMERSLKSPSFIRRVFGEQEWAELTARHVPVQSAAACFATKEAFAKVTQIGIFGFSLTEVQLLHKENGAPYLQISGEAEKIYRQLGLSHFAVSITHTDTNALAFLVAE